MIIKKIVLKNVGPFSDFTTFNLTPNSRKNISLIGGKNGSGKTTLLKSIKIGLFGAFAYGFKTMNDKYIQNLKTILNFQELKKDKAFFCIYITIEIEEGYKRNDYELRRFWNSEKGKLSETLEVINNGIKLKDNEAEDIIELLKENYPPKVIDSVLFDGEKIAELIENDDFPEYIREIFETSFSLNYFRKAIEDTEQYLISDDVRISFSSEELMLIDEEKRLKQLQLQLKEFEKSKTSYVRLLSEKNEFKKSLEHEFKKKNGINKEDKEQLLSKVNLLETEKTKSYQILRLTLENDYFYMSNSQRLKDIDHSIKAQKPIQFIHQVEEIEKFLGNNIVELDNLKSQLRNMSEVDRVLYNIDEKSSKRIEMIVDQLTSDSIQEFKKQIVSYFELQKGNKSLKILLGENEKNFEVSDLLSRISEVNIEIKILDDKIEEIEDKIVEANSTIKGLITEIENLETVVKQTRKANNSLIIARDIIKVLSESEKIIRQRNLQFVSDSAYLVFTKVIRKEKYISRIAINSDFSIDLWDGLGNKSLISLLSAGEKQLLVASVIFSIVKAAKRDMFFVFDTPLARLDGDNRTLFIKHLLSEISSQVIVLSTDSEVTHENYKAIFPRISHDYTLNYDEENYKTTAESGYFNLRVEEQI